MSVYDWEIGTDMAKLRNYRNNRLERQMKEDGVDVLITMRVDNVRYMTSFRPIGAPAFYYFRYAAVKKLGEDPYLLAASGDYDRAKNDMPWLAGRVKPLPMDVALSLPIFNEVLKELNLPKGSRIGVDEMGYALYDRLTKANPALSFMDGGRTMARAKLIKGPEEVDLIRQSSVIAEAGMRAGIDSLAEGVSELEAAAAVYAKMVLCGSEGGHVQPPMICSGENAVKLTRFPTERRIRNRDFVLMDIGCVYNGYNSDYCRTVLVGKATQEQKKIYRVVYNALQAAIEVCKPGVSSADVDRASRDVLRDAGYEKYWFFGVTGHGIGISPQEAPFIGDQSAKGEVPWTLEPGMVFSLEPSIHLPGVGGVRLEDTVLVTETGFEVLTMTGYQEELLS